MDKPVGKRPRRRHTPASAKYDWARLGIEAEHHRLLVLQWDDLFSEEGLDTWQVRSSNIGTLLQEFIESTRVAEAYAPHRYALGDLASEALHTLERDEIVREHFPFLSAGLTELARKAEDASAPLVDCRRSAVVLLGRLRDYRIRAVEELRRALSEREPKEKERQLRLTMTFASELVASGTSLAHLKAAGSLLIRGRGSFLERFEDFVSICKGTAEEYTVFFALQGWRNVMQPQGDGRLRFLDPDELSSSPAAEMQRFLEIARPDSAIAKLRVKAPDPYSARNDADRALASATAAMTFASFKEPTLKQPNALVIGPDGNTHLIAPDDSRRKYMRMASDWAQRTADLLRLFEELHEDDAQQLSATLQYYRLAIAHQTDEVRVVNMWVATENLVSRIGGASIVERVSDYLVPLVATRNMRRLARAYCTLLVDRISFKDLRALGLLVGRQVSPVALLRGLRDNETAGKLLSLLEEHPLLRYRLYRFATGPLKNGPAAAGYVEAHAQNVSWQLRRIYRARNAIVHRGQAPHTLRQLLQHLHAYLWTAIRTLTDDLAGSRGQWTIADALEHRRSLFQHSLQVLRGSGQDLPIEALIEPDAFLRMRAQFSGTGTSNARGPKPSASGGVVTPSERVPKGPPPSAPKGVDS